MKEATPSQPIDVVCAIICHPKHPSMCLVAQRNRNDRNLPEKWEFPGGKVEVDESPDKALIREIQEELGIQVGVRSSMTSVVHEYSKFTIRLIPYICDWLSGDIHASEHAATDWCTREELQGLDWAPADLPIVKEWIQMTLS